MSYEDWLPDAFMLSDEENYIEDSDPDLDPDLTDGVWTTADGRRIEISKMSDRHLANTLAMIEEEGFVNESIWLKLLKEELTKRVVKMPNFNLLKIL